MRLLASVLIGGAAIGLFMPGMPTARLAPNAPTFIVALVVVSVIVGMNAQRLGWLASGAAAVLGIALWIALYLRPSPPWAPSDNWTAETWLGFITLQVIPWTLFAGLFGALGSRISRAYNERRFPSRQR